MTGPCTQPFESSPRPQRIILVITLPSMPKSSKRSLPFRFPDQNYACIYLSQHVTCPTHLILLDFITLTMFGEETKLTSSSLLSPLKPPVISSNLGTNILLSTLFSNTLNLWSSLKAKLIFTPIYRTGKIIVVHILIFIFYLRRKDGRFWTEW